MKTILKLTGVIALSAVMILSFNACFGSAQKNGGSSLLDIDIGEVSLGPFPPAFMTPQPFKDSNAVDFVANIKIGWNLGNTLDAIPWPWDEYFEYFPNPTVAQLESLWVRDTTTPELFKLLKAEGFNAVRIPVSWAKAADKNYNLRRDWIERVTQIVNYAAASDMYIILNTHHDEHVFKFRNRDSAESFKAFKKIWTQIAAQFKNYNEKLIFEGLNEPRTHNSANEWGGGTPEERENLNKHYEIFVDVVRNSGGNNGKRFLMINSYAASSSQIAISGLRLPPDPAENKLIVSVHSYSPYNFALNANSPVNTWSKNNSSDTSSIISEIDRVYNKYVKNGIPVIIGEFGAMNKYNDEAREAWAEFFVGYAREKNIPCVWWDNCGFEGSGELFGIVDRYDYFIVFPGVVNGLMRGAGLR